MEPIGGSLRAGASQLAIVYVGGPLWSGVKKGLESCAFFIVLRLLAVIKAPEQIRKFCILNAKCVRHRYLRNQLLIGINLADLGVLPNLHPDEDQRQNDRNAADYFGDQSVLLEFFP